MSRLATSRRSAVLAVLCGVWPLAVRAQQRDTTVHPADSLKVYTLPPAVVSVTRANPPINRIPRAVHLVDQIEISRARPTWGLDEALVTVPGVYAANRYNFSLDQRISIRGFGARSAFAVRGIKVLVDGIPQTLPDGQGQLTNLELGAADRIEILRGSASALFGNASGGVISIWTDPTAPRNLRQEVRVLFGTFDRDLNRNWSKWQSSTSFRVGAGSGLVTVSRLDYTGQRQHSDADFRNLNSRWHFPLANGWSLAATADIGWDPRADNPGALTAAEMARNPDSAAAINITRVAGKDVTQGQGGVTLRRQFEGGGEASLTLFGIARSLKNPTTCAYIDLDRLAYGARAAVSRPLPLGRLDHRLTAGIDFQRQRDDRHNFGNNAGQPDTVRSLDQLERVTEVGPFVQSALQITPRVSVTGGLRYDWVTFRADDRLITPTNPDDSGQRLMRALSAADRPRPGVLPERREVPPPRYRAGHGARDCVRTGPDDHLDLLRLSLHELYHRDTRPRRPPAPRHPAALAPLPAEGAAGVRARGLGRGRGDSLVGLRGPRHARHRHEPLVGDRRAPRLGWDGGHPAVASLRGLEQRVEPLLRRVGGYQRGEWALL